MDNQATRTDNQNWLLDAALLVFLGGLLSAYFAVGGTPENEWRASPGNALLGINAAAWGATFFLGYRKPSGSLLLRALARLSLLLAGPLGHKAMLVWSVFLLFAGTLMFITGAGLV